MLWGAFNNASSAMQSMSWSLGSISQNIANVNTTGYKAKETLFQTVMSEHKSTPTASTSGLNIFGVQTADRNLIQAQGVITSSSSWSDLAINGRGFFMLGAPGTNGAPPTTPKVTDAQSILYSRDGGFHQVAGADERAYFMNGSGNYLLGWMADDTGAIAGITPPTDGTTSTLQARLSAANSLQLEPVYTYPVTTMAGRATTSGHIVANIPSTAAMTPSSNTTTFEVTDSLGAAVDMTLTWQRVDGTTWTVTPSLDPAVGDVTSPAVTVTMDCWGNITDPSPLTQNVDITWAAGHYSGPADQDVTTTFNVSAGKPIQSPEKISLQVFDENYNEHTLVLGMERAEDPSGQSTWYMFPSEGPGVTPTAAPTAIRLTFDGNGQISSGSPANISMSWPATTDTPAGSVAFEFDLNALTQYDGPTQIKAMETDGYASGRLLHTDFNERGECMGFFDNGRSRILFKVPLATFVSENSLNPITGNLFSRTPEAGDIQIAGVEDTVGNSYLSAGSLENSTVNIENEFTRMIMTQKAYSTNAQVFKTADDMTVTARDLKR